MSAGPIAETWYGGARYAELTSTDPPMSTIAVATVTRSPLTATPSAPASHSSSTTVEHVLPRHEVVASRRCPAGTAADESVSWITRPGPVIATRPAAIRASWSSPLRAWVTVVPPCPAASRSWICAAEVEDLLLEVLLLRLEVERRRHQRRPLLARDPDPRALGRELGGDQEAEREQRDAERHLPGRDRSDAGGERRHARWSGGAGARPRDQHDRRRPPRRAPGPAAPDRATTSRRRDAGRPRVAAASRSRHPSPPRRPRLGDRAGRHERAGVGAGPDQPEGSGPAGRGLRTVLLRDASPRGRRASPPGTRRGPRPARA